MLFNFEDLDISTSISVGEDTGVETAWAAEIERRIAEVDSSEIETVSWEEAQARIRSKLAKS